MKTMYFFIAIDKDNNKTVACNGVIIHQMLPDTKAYITSVYTDEDYRQNGIQNELMKIILAFIAVLANYILGKFLVFKNNKK